MYTIPVAYRNYYNYEEPGNVSHIYIVPYLISVLISENTDA